MESLSVDFTYGEALFEAARDVDKLDVIQNELAELCELFEKEPELYALIKTPTVSAEQKKTAAEKIFDGKISEEMLNFLYILIDKRRVHNFRGIMKYYRQLYNENEGITYGEVWSVMDLEEEEIGKLEKETSELFRKKVRLENKIDESLIGGIKIYIDGKLIDGSIKKRLEDLKEVLI